MFWVVPVSSTITQAKPKIFAPARIWIISAPLLKYLSRLERNMKGIRGDSRHLILGVLMLLYSLAKWRRKRERVHWVVQLKLYAMRPRNLLLLKSLLSCCIGIRFLLLFRVLTNEETMKRLLKLKCLFIKWLKVGTDSATEQSIWRLGYRFSH